MDFDLNQGDSDIKATATRLARGPLKELGPIWDQERVLAREANTLLADSGLLRLLAPRIGAPKVRALPLVLVREQLASASAHVDSLFAVQGLASYPIVLGGSDDQRDRYLPGLTDGRLIGAFAVTEPEAGSDLGGIATVARETDGGWTIDGSKDFISHAGFADIYVVFARLERSDGPLSAFVVEASNPGLTAGPVPELMASHVLASLTLDGCRVPGNARLAGLSGDDLVSKTLELFRPSVGAAAVGLASAALQEALEFTAQRHQFGRPVADFQAVRFRLAEMATRLEAARNLVYRAAWELDSERPGQRMLSSMAKLFATEAAGWIVDQAVQLHGAKGLMRGTRVELLYREERALRIYEGTSEIQHLIIASELRHRHGQAKSGGSG